MKKIQDMMAEEKNKRKSSSSLDSKYQKQEELTEKQEELTEKKIEKKRRRPKSEKSISFPSKSRSFFKRHPIPHLRYLLQQNLKMKYSKKK